MPLVSITYTSSPLKALYRRLFNERHHDVPVTVANCTRTLNHLRLLIEGFVLEDIDDVLDVEALFDVFDTADDITQNDIEMVADDIKAHLRHYPPGSVLAAVPVDSLGTLLIVLKPL